MYSEKGARYTVDRLTCVPIVRVRFLDSITLFETAVVFWYVANQGAVFYTETRHNLHSFLCRCAFVLKSGSGRGDLSKRKCEKNMFLSDFDLFPMTRGKLSDYCFLWKLDFVITVANWGRLWVMRRHATAYFFDSALIGDIRLSVWRRFMV